MMYKRGEGVRIIMDNSERLSGRLPEYRSDRRVRAHADDLGRGCIVIPSQHYRREL